MENTQPKTCPAQEFVDSLNIEYKAEFVPQSQSRNADEKYPSGLPMPSLNWRVTVGNIETDYMQGYKHSMRATADEHKQQVRAAETGRTIRGRIPAPLLIDVLYSLVMDADVINYTTYEDWASSFGYNEDSRKGEKIYRQCLEIALQLRQLIDLDAAAEAFADY